MAMQKDLAKLVKARPEHFRAIATLPMQAPTQAADELRHAARRRDITGRETGQTRRVEAADLALHSDLLPVLVHEKDHAGERIES